MLINKNWTVYEEGHKDKAIQVDLPDDRMLSTKRDINNPGGVNISFFAGGKYIYEKDLDIFLEEGESVFFEFEGVYAHPTIIINGQEACHREYGYTDFIFEATPYIKNGANHIEVIADNSHEPNSRWYTGSGIYRPVHMWILPKAHILPRSIRITTTNYQKGEILLEAKFSQVGKGMLRILDNGSPVFEKEFESESLNELISIPNAKLWNVGRGNLYEAEIHFEKDEAKTKFGIRQIELNKDKGFLINGERVILKGCCIHHDNGLLGA
ncbi:MAG: glycoside hydrolase family 2, partial [Mollicutes bacterium]|nr:glycoside hydrolase family 2 [Mollicutes bacterium]